MAAMSYIQQSIDLSLVGLSPDAIARFHSSIEACEVKGNKSARAFASKDVAIKMPQPIDVPNPIRMAVKVGSRPTTPPSRSRSPSPSRHAHHPHKTHARPAPQDITPQLDPGSESKLSQ